MAECIVGDITPSDNVSKEDKHKMEREAMERIMRLVGMKLDRSCSHFGWYWSLQGLCLPL